MFADKINISDRVSNQLPEFIRDEDQQLVNFLFEYYKSQEKTGRAYNVLNNLLEYLDIDAYDPKILTSNTILIKDVDTSVEKIEVEQIDGFLPKDGSVMIDNEVIYYQETVRGPDAILTPGISLEEFNKKRQNLESPISLFDGVKTTFDLKFLGTPVSPVSADHLVVTVYGTMMQPTVDYTISGSQIVFTTPPRAKTGTDQTEFTQILYYIGFADSVIKKLEYPDVATLAGDESMPITYNSQPYSPISEIGLIINRNGTLQRPYIDYVLTDNNTRIKFFVNITSQDVYHIRSIEYVSPSVGSGAEAVTRIGVNGEIEAIIIKNGGSGYELNFAPKVSIYSSTGVGGNSAARSLVSGIKNIQLISGGQGYTSYNPPLINITPPSDLINGSRATAAITVDDTTGQVNSVTITDSGSGYDFIPAITFQNPGGATISDPTIDGEGRLNVDSISVLTQGIGYSNPPTIYIDAAPVDGIDAEASCTVSPDGQVVQVTINNRGRGYLTPPRARIIQPVGAQVLDVTVANGSVTNINLLTGGAGYTDAPSVYIVDDRKGPLGEAIGGTGALAAATIFNGEITDINIISFGTGYSTETPPKVYIAEPLSAASSCDVGFGEITGCKILSAGSYYEPSAFLNCARGVSDIVQFDNYGNQIYAKEAQLAQSNHTSGAVVHNLDSQIIRQVFDKFRRQYMPTINIDYSQVNPIQVIKTIKDFYISKGTKTAAQYLFKILFGEQVDVYYPREELVTPSAASWIVDTILRAELISGDPANLPNSQLNQFADDVDPNIGDANVLIENVISIIEGTDVIYELAISEETLSGVFKIPYKTVLAEPLTTTENIITVDSTIGWPEKNGTIIIGDSEVVQYKEKSLNQFIECTRSKNGVVEDWDPGTTIFSDIFVYVNRGLTTEVKLRVLGIAEAGTTVLEDSGSYYLPGDKLNVAALGSTANDKRLNSWLYNVKKLISVTEINPTQNNNSVSQIANVVCSNPHGLLVEDKVTIYGANPAVYNGTFEVTSRLDEFTFTYNLPVPTDIVPQGNILLSVDLNRGKSNVTSINEVISLFTSNIQNSFFNSAYVYIAASGLPNYKVGPFTGSALIPGNQRKLLRFPRTVETVSTRTLVSPNTPIGSWVNGVAAWSYKSADVVTFGPLTSISILTNGEDYDAGSKPALEITGGGGTGAAAAVTVNGSLFSIAVTNEGTGYTTQPLISIVGGGGSGATAQAVVTNGRVTRILVENSGTGYTSQPTISITGGGGTGALASAQVRGPISGVTLTSAGSGYTSTPSIRLNSGEGALAQPIVINGRIVSIAIINSGSGYTTAPTIFINGDGFGAQATAVIGTLGEDKGKVISVTITNRGVGYTQGMTTVRLEAVGQLATFQANVFQWNKNLEYDLASKYDVARGYVFTGFNNQYGGEYAHISDPKELRYVVGDNVVLDPVTQSFREIGVNETHSPIIGWAFDGNPIYGPYGYIDPTDQNSGLRRMRSSYKLKDEVVYDLDTNPTPSRTDGPALSSYPAGIFVNDYEYAFQLGDLDPYNGRFCKTPDFPAGTYAYFITIDESDQGLPVFPYIIGPQFNSVVDTWNLSLSAVQENIPLDVSRFRDPYANVDIDIERQPNQESDQFVTEKEGDVLIFEIEDIDGDGLITPVEIANQQAITEEAALQIYDYFPLVSAESRVDIEVETTTKFESAQIDGFVIENPGVSYQVNDTLFFDNTGTGGFGASAQIESVVGESIASYQKEIINDIPYGKIVTGANHELIAQDEIIVSSRVITENTNKRFYMSVVTGIETISVDQIGVGYNEQIPATYEIIASQGQDVELDVILDTTTGKIGTVNIINSGYGYSVDAVPQIRVSHPQQYKKTYYWVNQYAESAASFEIFDIQPADDRTWYVCGELTETNGNSSAFLAKFSDLGGVIWDRTLLPSASIKKARFKRIYLDQTTSDDHIIYVLGETESQSTAAYNPDILVVKYLSGLDNANNPEGIVQWQKEIAGVSGATRSDYAGDLYMDDEQRLYICGWTDTNSVDPDDIWIMQLNSLGDVIEKRKFASPNKGEQLHQIHYIGNDKIIFCGIDLDNNDLMFGEMVYDGSNIEMRYVKKLAVSGGQVRRPQFVIDSYNDLFFTCDMWNGTKHYGVALFKIAMSQVETTAASPTWTFSKIIAPSIPFESITHAGISLDEFGNINLVTHVLYEDNNQQAIINYIKYDGTTLKKSNVISGAWNSGTSSTDYGLGFTAHNHTVDNSGDVIIPANIQKSVQSAVYRFNDTNDLYFDSTKQKKAIPTIVNSAQLVYDSTVQKFGTGSLKFQQYGSLSWANLDNNDDWTVAMWVKMDTSHDSNNPIMEMITAIDDAGSTVKLNIIGAASDANFGKIRMVIAPQGASAVTVDSVGSTYFTTMDAGNWHHIAFVKEEPSLGSYDYSIYFDGVRTNTATSTADIAMDDLTIGCATSGQAITNSFLGHIDDIAIEPRAVYTGSSLQVPTERYRITTSNSNVDYIKFDREHSKRADYQTSTDGVVFTENTNLNINNLNNPIITVWNEGASGLQILDYSDVTSQLNPGTYTFSETITTFASKTSTIPTPLGKRLLITPNVVAKYYIRDAGYSKIDNVLEFTFNQAIKYSKGTIIQQFNSQGITQAFGTIVEVPTGTLNNPGLGTKYKIGKIYGNFNDSDRFRNDTNEENTIDNVEFNVKRPQDQWVTGKAYVVGDQVYSSGKIYAATNSATSGSTAPTHSIGIVTDGAVTWNFISVSGTLQVNLADYAWPRPSEPEWEENRSYSANDFVYYGRYKYQAQADGIAGPTAPVHTTGTVSDGNVNWAYVSTYTGLDAFARFRPYAANDYRIQIMGIYTDSDFIVGDVISLGNSITAIPNADNPKIADIDGIGSVSKIRFTVNLDKDIIRTANARTDLIYATATTKHNLNANDILYVEGFTTAEFNGSFFVQELFSSRDYTYRLRATATADPLFVNSGIANVKISSKHPTLLLVRNHSYIFDMSDTSNFGYFLSFSQDNQFKLEYSFNVIEREGTPGVASATETPTVQFTIGGEVTNITYYFDPSRLGSNSPVGTNSFIDVIKTPFDGTFRISEIISDTEFRFPLLYEPEFTNANIGLDDQDEPNSKYSTTSVKAIGPINNIKLISPGGFYQRLPVVSDIASDRKIEKVRIVNGGTEYAVGVYTQVPILGDGEGGLVQLTVEVDEEIGSGTITAVALTDPGKGYTEASIDVDGIEGILGPTLSGSGAELNVVIPAEGTGAAVFLTGRQIGKIKTLKNNEFGYGYSHDYTLRPEIAFPVNLQLFNTSILSQITITNPGAGYTSPPSVIIEGGGGSGAEAEAIVKNNRLSEILIKNPGAGYSSQPSVTLKSEFTYVVNLDLNYLQFNFPHGITTGAAVQFRAEDIGSTVGVLPKPSSVGLTSLSSTQTYYAITGDANSLESDQLRFALTAVDAQSGNFITFLTQGDGRQVLLTEVFGGQADAVVETSRFLEGEEVFQGETYELASAFGFVSENEGWQIQPKILKITNPQGDFVVGGKVQGVISRASGIIDNLNIAKGVLNIDALTRTPGRFIDDVGKPSEIVQKIQDSYFYQNFSYVIKSKIPINRWKEQILENNHPVGFNMFGQLELTGGKDVSGRKVVAGFTKQVNINEYSNVNQITSFGAAQPIYSTFNNSEVLFRKKRLTNSEEILTSIVKKIDNIASQFDGSKKSFPIAVEGENLVVNENQLLITLNGIIQAPGTSYSVVGNNIVFAEPPKPDSKVVYRNVEVDLYPITRFNLNTIGGIFPSIGDTVRGFVSSATARVVATGATSVDVVDIQNGPFVLNERIDVSRTGFSALIGSIDDSITKIFLQNIGGTFTQSALAGDKVTGATTGATATIQTVDTVNQTIDVVDMANGYFDRGENVSFFAAGYGANVLNVDSVNYKTIFEFGETVTSLDGNTAVIEENNLDLDGVIDDKLVLSKTSGTSEYETGTYSIFLNDIIYSASSNIAAKITSISPYRDPIVSINLVRPVGSTSGSWSSFEEGDKFQGPGGTATGEIVRIDFEANPVRLYYLKSSEAEISDGETIQRYFPDAQGNRLLDSLTEVVAGDNVLGDIVDTLIINKGSTFNGIIFERLISLTNQNVILDNISETTITPTELTDADNRINADFLDFEEVRSTEIEYENLTGGVIAANDMLRSITFEYGNQVTNAKNRWQDGGRMISLNKEEIVDFANAQIAVEHPGFYYPGDNMTDAWSRYADAYRLIIKNIDYIANKAYALMVAQYPSLTIPSGPKCIRDTKYMIEALAFDVYSGGTKYTRKLLQKYFSTDGTTFLYVNNEAEATNYAFGQAVSLMKQALSNMLTGSETVDGVTYVKYNERTAGGSSGTGITADPSPGNPYGTAGTNTVNYSATNCSDVQSALQTLYDNVSVVLTAGSLADLLDEVTVTQYTAHEIKCRRDIGYLVDALSTDITTDGNFQTVKFIKTYFDNIGVPISNGFVGEVKEYLSAFKHVAELCKRAINNLLYVQVNTRTPETGYMLKDPTTYQGPYLGAAGTTLTQFTPTAVTYTPANGQLVMTIGNHSLTTSDTVKIRPYSLNFTCTMDGGASFHPYPRTGDPAFNADLNISATTQTAITVDVGASPLVQYTPTGATYDPATGVMVLTIGSHSLDIGDPVTIANNSITFTCTQDDNATNHTYPRTTDPASGASLPVVAKDTTTISVNVGASAQTDQYAHTFVSASSNAVSSGGGFTHTFVSAEPNAVYNGGGTEAAYYDPNYYSGVNEGLGNCADVQAGIHTLITHVTTAIGAGSLSAVPTGAALNDGGYVENENLRVFKIAYKDLQGNGFFLPGETIRGATSNANFVCKGTNAGLKWLFTNAVTGSFTDREYVSNSKLTVNGSAVLTKLEKKAGTQSIRFDAGSYLAHTLSDRQKFGTNDFTIEMWIRPNSVSGTQFLYDTRTTSATLVGSPVLYLDGTQIKYWYDSTDHIVGAHNLTANVWGHIALTRTTGITKLFVNGTQVGGDYNDTNNYLERPFNIAADWQGANGFVGHMDNFMLHTESKYSNTFTPGFTYPTDTSNVTFGLDCESPIIISTEDCFGTYTGQTNSTATSKKVNYDNKTVIIEDIDLGRDSYREAADILELNLDWMAETAVGLMAAKYPDFIIPGDSSTSTTGTAKCVRDTKEYIAKAIIADIRYGGNYNSTISGRGYLTKAGGLDYVGNELLQSVYAWNELANVMNYIITTTSSDLVNYPAGGTKYTEILRVPNNFSSPASQAIQDEITSLSDQIINILAPTGDRFRDAGDALWKNRDYIAEEVALKIQDDYKANINGTDYDFLVMPGYGQPYCERDIKVYILPAVVTDLLTGGNSATQYAIDQYINPSSQIIHVEDQLSAMLDAFEHTKKLAHHAINQTLLTFGTTASSLGISAEYADDYYVAQYTQIAAYRDTTVTIDTQAPDQSRVSPSHNIWMDTADQLERNKHVIAWEAVHTMNDMSYFLDFQVPGGRTNCADDLVDVIEAMIHDIRLGGNSKTWDAAALYLDPEDSSLIHVEGEDKASKWAMTWAMEIAILTMRNGFGRENLYIYDPEDNTGAEGGEATGGGGASESFNEVETSTYEQNGAIDRFIDAANIVERNIRFIAEQAVHEMLVQYPSLHNTDWVSGVGPFTPAAGSMTYDAATGVITYDHGSAHGLTTGRKIYVRQESLVFTCTKDNNNSEHAYPRTTDPWYNKGIAITSTGTNTFTFNVGAAGANDQYVHTFVRAEHEAITVAGKHDCVQDVTDVLDAMQWNLRHGGNNKVFHAAEMYTDGTALAHVSGYVTEVTWVMNKARDLAIQVMRQETVNTTGSTHGFSQKLFTDLDFFPYNQSNYVITADGSSPLCADVASALTTFTSIVTDTLANPVQITDGTIQKSLPNIWPIKYANDMANRDTTITFDENGGTSGWNNTCVQAASGIETLFNLVMDTIEKAASSSPAPSHLTTVTRTTPYNSNAAYQYYTCYNVISASDTLFDLMIDTLGGGNSPHTGGNYSERFIARYLTFNKGAISRKAFAETQSQYPTTNAEIGFAETIMDAVIYDLNTRGNAGMMKYVNTWFDGEGNFIAFPTVVRQHLVFYLLRIAEAAKRISYDQNNTSEWGAQNTYDAYFDPTLSAAILNRIEYQKESTEFFMDASINVAEFALTRGTPPTNNTITWINNTHATNDRNLYDEGNDWNTDPDLVLNTPTVEVGFERREHRVKITRPNFYSRGDVLTYVPASSDIEKGLQGQNWFYVLNATPSYFEISREIRHDARYSRFRVDTLTTGQQQFAVDVRSGIERATTTFGVRDIDTPVSGGFNIADVVAGITSESRADVISTRNNEAKVIKLYSKFFIDAASGRFTNGETIQVQGSASNNGTIVQTSVLTGDNSNEGYIYVENITGAFSDDDVLEGVASGVTASVNGTGKTRMLVNLDRGAFAVNEMIFNKANSAEADIILYENSAGALTSNTGGRISIDIESLDQDFVDGDIIYGSVTDRILDIADIRVSGLDQIELNQFVHGTKTVQYQVASVTRDQGFTGDFAPGDLVYLLQGTIPKEPGWTAVVTEYNYDQENSIHNIYLANFTPYGSDANGNTVDDPNLAVNGAIGKFENLNNFPIIFANLSSNTITNYTSYGRVAGKAISGTTGRLWLEDVSGDFPSNMSIISDYGWTAGVTQSKGLLGRCDRYFRGFDGVATTFKLTVNNGERYFPDPAGHILTFINGVLQPPGANFAYTAFSDQIQFTEPPTIGSEFIGYYVGKLRQLDDISFEFDSLRSSFNLKYLGGFYSLTLTEGVDSATILPENNIICSLNGVIQEPGIGYELVGSRIIFAETPRAGSTFVAFSYIGSDADVIAATVVPPIEAGDVLEIEGEGSPREVALIESSNSLITFEYTGTVKGRDASALSTIKAGEITKAIITTPGDGYSSRPQVDVISSTGFDGRVRALMGISSIVVKTAGIGYALPDVVVETTVEDDFVAPTGGGVNGGFDTYLGQGTDADGNPIVIVAGYIIINAQPTNVTVNQGQTASFTVDASFRLQSDNSVGTTPLNYQWQRKQYGETAWANITGSTQAIYTSNAAEQADDGDEFRVAITAAGAQPVYSNSVILTVQTGATVISNFTPNQLFQ